MAELQSGPGAGGANPPPGGNTTAPAEAPPIRLIMVSSPHVLTEDSTPRIMRDVLISLAPAVLAGVWFFGLSALGVVLLSIAGCVAAEALLLRLFRPQISVRQCLGDGSALVTGLLLGLNLASSAPWWMVLAGCVVAMSLGKHVYGGLGQNLFNPALVARVFLLIAFPVQMTHWPKPTPGDWLPVDAATGATPLAVAQLDGVKAAIEQFGYADLFLGAVGGCIGEVSVAALLLGGLYLMIRRVIRWEIPVSFLLTVLVFAQIFHWIAPDTYAPGLYHFFSGALFLGAFFMATDYVTSPMAPKGMIVFGVGCGLLTMIIRLWGGYPEGVSFAILIMNSLVPIIDRHIKPKRIGLVVPQGAST